MPGGGLNIRPSCSGKDIHPWAQILLACNVKDQREGVCLHLPSKSKEDGQDHFLSWLQKLFWVASEWVRPACMKIMFLQYVNVWMFENHGWKPDQCVNGCIAGSGQLINIASTPPAVCAASGPVWLFWISMALSSDCNKNALMLIRWFCWCCWDVAEKFCYRWPTSYNRLWWVCADLACHGQCWITAAMQQWGVLGCFGLRVRLPLDREKGSHMESKSANATVAGLTEAARRTYEIIQAVLAARGTILWYAIPYQIKVALIGINQRPNKQWQR